MINKDGGPNWMNNYTGAPVMVDTATKEIYYTPLYYIMSHFSKFIRPGDRVLDRYVIKTWHQDDDIHAAAVISQDGSKITVEVLNTSGQPVNYGLFIGIQNAQVLIPANSIQTIVVHLL
jgi:glucosylceramidase